MSETNNITAALLIEIPKRFPNIRVWRSNTGGAVGVRAVQEAIAYIRVGNDSQAIKVLSRVIKFGVEGQADISGIIGPFGRMLQIEVKAGRDRQSEAQQNFEAMVTQRGGVYIIAHDVLHALELIASLPEEFC